MINTAEYVTNARAQGMSENAIRSALLSMGYAVSNIDAALGVSPEVQPIAPGAPVTIPMVSTTTPASAPLEVRPTAHVVPAAETPPSQNPRFNFFSFRGRIGRLRYFITSIAVVATFSIITTFLFRTFLKAFLFSQLFFAIGIFLFLFLLSILVFIISLSLVARRFHDLNRSGWWWFALLIPIYDLYLAILLLFRRGTIGENKYGGDPKLATEPETDFCDRLSRNPLAIAGVMLGFFALIAGVSYIGARNTINSEKPYLINQAIQQSTSSPLAANVTLGTSVSVGNGLMLYKNKLSLFPTLFVPPACYSITYPDKLVPQAIGTTDFNGPFGYEPGSVWFKDPAAYDGGKYLKGGVAIEAIFDEYFSPTSTIESVAEAHSDLTGASLQKFTTAGGLKGVTISRQQDQPQSWAIVVMLPRVTLPDQKTGIVTLRMTTPPAGPFYNVHTAQTMAESIVPTCEK